MERVTARQLLLVELKGVSTSPNKDKVPEGLPLESDILTVIQTNNVEIKDFLIFLRGEFVEAHDSERRKIRRMDYVMNGGLCEDPQVGFQMRLASALKSYLDGLQATQ